jgi:hypothetical protein
MNNKINENAINISVNIDSLPHANNLKWTMGNWEDIFKVTALYEYSATKFKNGKRNNISAKGVSSIILDIDDGQTLEEGIETFKEFKSLIVTTKSHQVDKKGLIADRYRVILPLNQSIIDMEYYSKLMRCLTRFYKADIACSDPARYYSPNPKQEVYYSASEEYFDINKFDELVCNDEEVMSANIASSKIFSEKSKTNSEVKRIDLDLNSQVTYYQNGIKATDILDYIINNIKVSNGAIPCHCFLNPQHEDKNPSCFICQTKC